MAVHFARGPQRKGRYYRFGRCPVRYEKGLKTLKIASSANDGQKPGSFSMVNFAGDSRGIALQFREFRDVLSPLLLPEEINAMIESPPQRDGVSRCFIAVPLLHPRE